MYLGPVGSPLIANQAQQINHIEAGFRKNTKFIVEFLLILSIIFTDTMAFSQQQINNSPVVNWARSCQDPCELPKNFRTGGSAADFVAAAIIFRNTKKYLRVVNIDQCSSACVLLVDTLFWINKRVCIGRNIDFAVHLPYEIDTNGNKLLMPEKDMFSEPIKRYIKNNGGVPLDGSFINIPSSEVLSAYPECK